MLDDLKKSQRSRSGAQERVKLSLYVAGMLVLGGVIVLGTQGGGKATDKAAGPAAVAPGDDPAAVIEAPLLDPREVVRLGDADAAAPDRWCDGVLQYVLDIRRRGRIGDVVARHTVSDLAGLSGDPRGHVFEVEGKVTEVAGEAWKPNPDSTGNERLWTVVLEDAGVVPVLAVKYGNRSDYGEGAPVDAKPTGIRGERIAAGQSVIVRGVYVQRRTGSFGATAITKPAPVLLATAFRIVVPPAERSKVISNLGEALWEDVHDRTNRESRKWDEDALYEVIQWARARGYDACRDDILHGDLGWKPWERKRYDLWKKEVSVERDVPRPVTEASRGKVFRFSGIIGEAFDYGWEDLPRNRFAVDRIAGVTLLSDHYYNVSHRLFLAFPLKTFPGVTGAKEEHLRLYGVFIKNDTYDTRFKLPDGSGRVQPATVPLFVVLHAERFPEEEAGQTMRTAMLWVAGAMVLFGLLFYIVLIRGGQRQVERMEEHRVALRRRIRAKGQGATLPTDRSQVPPEDA